MNDDFDTQIKEFASLMQLLYGDEIKHMMWHRVRGFVNNKLGTDIKDQPVRDYVYNVLPLLRREFESRVRH